MKVVLTAEAAEELTAAALFYSAKATPALGQAFVDEVERALRLLVDQPLIGVVWRQPTRRLARAIPIPCRPPDPCKRDPRDRHRTPATQARILDELPMVGRPDARSGDRSALHWT